jgi:bifunctional non-homologous end joining protein LigD
MLKSVLQQSKLSDALRYSDHIQGRGAIVHEEACRFAAEGIICKKIDSTYSERRTRAWVKVKCIKRQEFVIGGFTEPSGSRKGFGALLLGYYEGDDLVYCGKVGTGFNDKLLRDLRKQMDDLERKTPPFSNPPTGSEAKKAHWVTPELLGEVEFTEWTTEGSLRHPSFQGLRTDKKPREVVRETPEHQPADSGNGKGGKGSGQKKSQSASPSKGRAGSGRSDAVEIQGVQLSNPDKVMYPEQGATKKDLAEYYAAVSDWFLPHVVNRPLSIVRCPQGRQKKCFFQKHVNESLPDAIRGVPIREKEGKQDYIVADDLNSILHLVQLGALEYHPWGSREDRVDRPDRLIFDLDPGEGVDWEGVVEGARRLREVLEDLELESYLKTSGGKGFHVVVPLVRRSDWDEAKEFTKAVAQQIAKAEPDRYTINMSKAKRSKKIFIDYLRNSRGATSVAAYSTRARAGAAVSTPVRWDELSPSLPPDGYTIENLPKRLKRLKKDPWEGIDKTSQSITKAIKERLGME